MRVLSLFDGMSCGRLALEKIGIPIEKYYASEISKSKIRASQNYFPDNIQIGDVTKVSGYDYDVNLLIGGSPCQGFSVMGKRLNFSDPRSKLILEYFRILEELKAKKSDLYFLLENVPMAKQAEMEISKRLGVLPVKINSALVSAQNRKRLYWTNIPGAGNNLFGNEIQQPKDKGVLLKDILQPENEVDEKYYLKDKYLKSVLKSLEENVDKYVKIKGEKSRCLLEGYNNKWKRTFISGELFNLYESGGASGRVYGTDNKSVTLKSRGGGGGAKTGLYLSNKRVRKLTPIECCRLQTVPDDFFNGSGLTDNQIYSCLGDGWTVDVIAHILKGLKT